MKKLFRCFVMIVMAGALWGCAELDLDGEPVDTGDDVQEVQAAEAPEISDPAWQSESAARDVTSEAYYSCEGKRCGEPCATGGYVCNALGQCKKENPACD